MSDRHAQMLNDLLELESGLTDWEANFIESLSQSRTGHLTEKQINVLERIWRERIEES